MKKILIIMLALLLCLGMISCRRLTERQVEEMIEEAVEDALEEQAEDDDEADDQEDEREDDKEDGDDDEDDDDDDVSVNAGDMTFDYSGDEIPDDFPTDDVPLYESRDAEIVGAAKTSMGDDYSFSLGIGTDDDTEDVIDEIKDDLEDMYKSGDINEISMDNYAMFVVDTDDWGITITIAGGEAEGFETFILYTVISK